jgi:DnaJ-class molecular chaperone
MNEHHPRYKECPECEGRGWATYEKTTKYGYSEYNADCDNCSATGQIEIDIDEEE